MSLLSSPQTRLFATMSRFLHRAAQEGAAELEQFGLTPAQFQMLVVIQSQPGIAQWRLARLLGVTKGNISQLVKKLEESALICRARIQGSDELALTKTGTTLLGRVVPAHDRFMDRTFAALSASEQDQLQALLQRIAVD
ncbi:MAG: MarR family winged helix-turn-helix transcriptional regulator [Propionicimonas sp.]